jgi:hypothetical protein
MERIFDEKLNEDLNALSPKINPINPDIVRSKDSPKIMSLYLALFKINIITKRPPTLTILKISEAIAFPLGSGFSC